MKLRAINHAMIAFRSGDDFKFFVVEPGDISASDLRLVRNQIRDQELWGIVRLDIRALLEVLKQMMLHSTYRQGSIRLFRRLPNQIIKSLRLSYFKSLGTAAALMNDSSLPLPAWFTIEDSTDVDAYLEIANEPFGVTGKNGPLSPLQDDHSDEIALLQQYRRWLTSGELRDLLEFHVCFAISLMHRLAAKVFAPAFRTHILHLLLTKGYPNVKDIIESHGFQSIARAIRNTTIYAAGMGNSNREIRFGLAQNLKQRIKAGDSEFLAALSDFIQQQNWEVVHKLKGAGHVVTACDIDDIVGLTAKYKAELVGMLLLAYGFSRAESVSAKEDEASRAS